MTVLKVADLDLEGKHVLIHEDLSVSMEDGQVQSDVRIRATLSTLKLALEKGAAVMVCSHLDRSTEGEFSVENNLKPVAEYLSKALGREASLLADYLDDIEVKADDLVLFENVCFDKGEKKNADELAQEYTALCDMFVMDAFSATHRAERSTHSVARFARVTTAGPLLAVELDALDKTLGSPARSMVAIVAGSKVSTKLGALNGLADICDQLIVGGGIANAFLATAGHKVGRSLYEADLVETAKIIAVRVKVPLLVNVVVAREFVKNAVATVRVITGVADDNMILDIGPQAATQFTELLRTSKTILWNSPVGMFEFDQLDEGIRTLANAIADSAAFSITDGGDTLTAIDKYGITGRVSYISINGGAPLEFVEDKTLPAVEILEQHAKG